ncbi:MAG: YbjN domain-containing protein, partial [Butyricicoccaceae bacterium]
MTDEKARAEQRFEAIRKMLDNIGSRGLYYTADRDQLRIKLQMPAGLVHTTCTFIVEDGDIIIMMIGTNIHVEDESAQMRVLRRINEINSRLIQGTFYLDPRDNEIMVSTGMHLGETMPDEDMLHDMLFAPLSSVRRQIEGLVAEILRSEPKQEKRGNDQLNALIAQMMDDA